MLAGNVKSVVSRVRIIVSLSPQSSFEYHTWNCTHSTKPHQVWIESQLDSFKGNDFWRKLEIHFCSNTLVSLYNTLSLSRPPRLFNNNEVWSNRRRIIEVCGGGLCLQPCFEKMSQGGAHECWRETSHRSYPGWGLSPLHLLSPLWNISRLFLSSKVLGHNYVLLTWKIQNIFITYHDRTWLHSIKISLTFYSIFFQVCYWYWYLYQ